MRLLDRYLIRELIVPLFLCLSGFLVLWISQDILNEMERFREAELTAPDLVEYYLYRLPEELPRILPIALLLALLYSLTNHARHNELVAIRCAGISLWRISIPFYCLGVLLSGSLFLITDFLLTDTQAALDRVLTRRLPDQENSRSELALKFNFQNSSADRVWEAASFDKRNYLLDKPILKWGLGGGESRTITAKTAYWTNNVWRFEGVTHWHKKAIDDTPPTQIAPFLEFPAFNETPKIFLNDLRFKSFDVKKLIKKSRFSLKEILLYLEYKGSLEDAEADMVHTQLHARLAAPWTCLVVVMIAIPFASLSGKRNVFVGVASSIVFCFSYFVLQRIGLALGTNGTLPPWLGAWSPNILFASLGFTLTWKVR